MKAPCQNFTISIVTSSEIGTKLLHRGKLAALIYLPENQDPRSSHSHHDIGQVLVLDLTAIHVEGKVRVIFVVKCPSCTNKGAAEREEDLQDENVENG